MPALNIGFNGGVVTARNPAHLRRGQLVQATGCYYRIGDSHQIHKIGGRVAFGNSFSNAPVRRLYLASFPDGSDVLIGQSLTSLFTWGAAVGGAAAILRTGMDGAGTLFGTHFRGEHVLVDGKERPLAYNQDATVRQLGMGAPVQKPAVALSFVTPAIEYPATIVGETLPGFNSWANGALVADVDTADPATFASQTTNKIGVNPKLTISGFSADTTTGRLLEFIWSVSGAQGQTGDGGTGGGGGGGGQTPPFTAGFTTDIRVQYSLDSGVTWVDWLSLADVRSAYGKQVLQLPLSVDSAVVQVRCWQEYQDGGGNATLRAWACRIVTALQSAFSTTAGIRYAVTEFDASRFEESPQGPDSAVVSLVSQNLATVTMPSAAINSRTTHWKIYRTPDGGAIPHQYGLLAMIPVSQTSFVDAFSVTVDVQLTPLLELVSIEAPNGGTLRAPANTPPPILTHVNQYSGSVVGVDLDGNVRYTVKGFAGKWPEIYYLRDFPFEQDDRPLMTATVGNTLLIGCSEVILAREGLPRAEDGTIVASPTRAIAGQPGMVAPGAAAVYAVDGVSRFAWVSKYGIHETVSGDDARVISRNLDWSTTVNTATLSSAILHYEQERRLLHFAYDSDGDGVNDRYWTFHAASEHRDEDGIPLATGPHYGNIASLASGIVSGTHTLFSGHASNGFVYKEDDGLTDESLAYDGTLALPLIIVTGKVYDEDSRSRIFVPTLLIRHNDAGTGQTASFEWRAYLDSEQAQQQVVETISLMGSGTESMLVGLGGDNHQIAITHTGTGSLSLEGVNSVVFPMGRSGHIGVY